MSAKLPSAPPPARSLELRAREAALRALNSKGVERVLIVYETLDHARVYAEAANGIPKKLEVPR